MDILKSNIAVGIGAAVAATMLAPVLLPVVASVGRPVAKSLIRGSLLFYEKSRETVAIAGEALEDLIAEIRAEEAARRVAPVQAEQAHDGARAGAQAAEPQTPSAPYGNGSAHTAGTPERPATQADNGGAAP